ncbi:MAG: hypothetical protein IPO21_15715 [Bacteroidales bacterium]|nr:hypothetical protein [Bacteroidales bacterium]
MKPKEILRFTTAILTLFFLNILVSNAQTGFKYEDYENIEKNSMGFFDDNIGGKYENLANPAPDLINPSNRVGAVYLVENSPDFSQINRMEKDSFYNFEVYPIFHFKIKNSNNVFVKAELFNTDKISVWTLIYNTKEVQINNSTWQDIYFDFSEFANRKDINHIAISFAKTHDSKDTIFVDDIEFLNYNSVSIDLVSVNFYKANKILELTTNLVVDESTVSLTDFTFSDPNIQSVDVSVNQNTIKLLLGGVTDNEFTVSYNKNSILGLNATILPQFSNFQIKNHEGLIYENFEDFSLVRFWNNWNEPQGCKTEKNINNHQTSIVNNTSKVTKIIEYKNSDQYASFTGLLEEKIDLTSSTIFTCKFFLVNL